MFACTDVCYKSNGAVAACVLFRDFRDAVEARSVIERIEIALPYEPGAFYKRELPCLLRVLDQVAEPLDAVVVDGYVWLSSDGRKGLGAWLHEALDPRVPVIGVAKTAFAGSSFAIPVLRGGSNRPLYVTAAGIDPAVAARWIQQMAGRHRIPALLKRVDRLCRDAGPA